MKKTRKNITALLLLAMLVQIVAPVTANFAFGEKSEDFRVNVIGTDLAGVKSIDWEFDFDSSKTYTEFEMELDLKLKSDLEGLLVDGGIQIGDYTISKDGKMIVDNFNKNLEEEVRKLLGLEQDQGEIIIQAEDKEKSVTEDVYEPEGKETPKKAEPVEHPFKGSFKVEVVLPLGLTAQPSAAVEKNLVTKFELSYTDGEGKSHTVADGADIEVDIDNLNAVSLKYTLVKPNEVVLASGDTYTIDLPEIFKDKGAVSNQPIIVEGETVATYSIINGEIVITFTDEIEDFDDTEMNVNISGEFNTEIFETQQEVEVEVPYQDGTSYTVTIRAEQKEYDGTDKKEAGFQYVLEGNEKVKVTRNPEYIDWTVRVNDSMESFTSAKVIDDLGENLEIVQDSFVVQKIIRNYKNEEVGRETINVTPTITTSGFEIDLGDIEDAYDITYTTRIIRPDGGGSHTINNKARIVLDGTGTDVSTGFEGTWSGDIPTLKKSGSISNMNADIIDWEVKYNYGKENLGIVILTDVLTHGEVIEDTIKVYQVNPDIDGKVSDYGQPTDGSFPLELDASGKAYYITFSSTVPVGLNNIEVTNTISDDLPQPNSDDAKVDVNTIPTGGKVGEQYVDENGDPYIEWTITMNTEKINVGSIEVTDVFNQTYLDFNVDNTSLYELKQDGKETDKEYDLVYYKHEDKREGFTLTIPDAGPYTYEFVYRTYYTVAGMNEPNLANDAELIFKDGEGVGIGDPLPVSDATLTGPKAGIEKSGQYIRTNNNTEQQIQWEVTFNKSQILLEKYSKITENFASNNFAYISGSLELKDADGNYLVEETDYSLVFNVDGADFVVTLLEETNKQLTLTFRTTVDDTGNLDHKNEVSLTWQGGTEAAEKIVYKRHPGINKTGNVVINDDGIKTVKWTVNFNTK